VVDITEVKICFWFWKWFGEALQRKLLPSRSMLFGG
jgi:hypothetical protein